MPASRMSCASTGGLRLAAAAAIALAGMLSATAASAGDARNTARPKGVPVPVPGHNEWVTSVDNQDNAGTGNPDGDLGVFLFNDDPISPIEFDIITTQAPLGRPVVLRMDNFDVDTDTVFGNPEIDEVFVNGKSVGILNGHDGALQTNEFAVPAGVVVKGRNTIQVKIDQNNVGFPNWGVTIDWGLLKYVGPIGKTLINRAWADPADAKSGKVNFFAEVSGACDDVEVLRGNTVIATLTDPDGDGTFTGSANLTAPLGDFTMQALVDDEVKHRWPLLTILPFTRGTDRSQP